MIVRQVPPDRTGFEQTVFVTAGLAQIVTLAVVVVLAVIFYRMWQSQQAIQEQLGRLASKIDPMLSSATSAAENVRALTEAVKRDAGTAGEALVDATSRVRDSVAGIADRIDDFGDLLSRVTTKAEAVADVAGAAVTTIKAGSRLFRSHREHRRSAPVPRHDDGSRESNAPNDEDADLDQDATLDEPIRLSEDDRAHAHDSPYADDASATHARHRRRRRRRRHGGGSAGDGAGGDSPPQ